jgi:hypothetical protein
MKQVWLMSSIAAVGNLEILRTLPEICRESGKYAFVVANGGIVCGSGINSILSNVESLA